MVHLDPTQSRHLRSVLRIESGEQVELFDSAGRTAIATVASADPTGVSLTVVAVRDPAPPALRLIIAAAPPKGPRADWMVEKLSELGVAQYFPLQTARTVVHPETGKLQRWQRLATESAKQCKRPDVMHVAQPVALSNLYHSPAAGKWCLSTDPSSQPAMEAIDTLPAHGDLLVLIGPEGGWTDDELAQLQIFGFASVHLTRTILRIETAAIALASIVMVAAARPKKEPS